MSSRAIRKLQISHGEDVSRRLEAEEGAPDDLGMAKEAKQMSRGELKKKRKKKITEVLLSNSDHSVCNEKISLSSKGLTSNKKTAPVKNYRGNKNSSSIDRNIPEEQEQEEDDYRILDALLEQRDQRTSSERGANKPWDSCDSMPTSELTRIGHMSLLASSNFLDPEWEYLSKVFSSHQCTELNDNAHSGRFKGSAGSGKGSKRRGPVASFHPKKQPGRPTRAQTYKFVRPDQDWPPFDRNQFLLRQVEPSADSKTLHNSACPAYVLEAGVKIKEITPMYEAALARVDFSMLNFVLAQQPFHIPALLRMAHILTATGRANEAANCLKRAVHALEHIHRFSSFQWFALYTERRVPYAFPENQPIFQTLSAYVHHLIRSGVCRTAFEYSKLLYNLDESDPMAVLLQVDFCAIQCQAYDALRSLRSGLPKELGLQLLPNLRYSCPLCAFFIERQIAASEQKRGPTVRDTAVSNMGDAKRELSQAIRDVPWIARALVEAHPTLQNKDTLRKIILVLCEKRTEELLKSTVPISNEEEDQSLERIVSACCRLAECYVARMSEGSRNPWADEDVAAFLSECVIDAESINHTSPGLDQNLYQVSILYRSVTVDQVAGRISQIPIEILQEAQDNIFEGHEQEDVPYNMLDVTDAPLPWSDEMFARLTEAFGSPPSELLHGDAEERRAALMGYYEDQLHEAAIAMTSRGGNTTFQSALSLFLRTLFPNGNIQHLIVEDALHQNNMEQSFRGSEEVGLNLEDTERTGDEGFLE